MTPAELIAAGQVRGVAFEARTLTDWRQKGLLPPLTSIGLGRGRGKRQVWTDPNVIDQALMVGDLLARRSRTRPALLRLWQAGFMVSSESAREIWLEQIAKLGAKLDDDEIGRLTGAAVRHLRPPHDIDQGTAEAVVHVILDAIYASGAQFDLSDVDPIVHYLGSFLQRAPEIAVLRELLDEDRVSRVHRAISAIYSRQAISARLRAAHAADLNFINDVMRRLRHCFMSAEPSANLSSEGPIARSAAYLTFVLSILLIPVLLLVLQGDRRDRVAATLDLAERCVCQFTKRAPPPDVRHEVRGIWRGVTLNEILGHAIG